MHLKNWSGDALPDPGAGIPSLYVHWPYCLAKCPYCDFNVHISKTQVDEARWVTALLTDLKSQIDGARLADLQTLYFGGGTPSLLSPRAISDLITDIRDAWSCARELQISLEVHPTSADTAKFEAFKAAGVDRVSIGVQSFDDTWLTFLGRDHDSAEAGIAVRSARDIFDSVNLDLMTAMPGMSLDEQARQIDRAIETGVDHLSVYQLGIEPGTAFGAAVRRGDWQPKNSDEAADFFDAAAAQIVAAGYTHYEVSNFAKPGAESRHSLLGWLGHAYIGIGPGAEGRSLMNDGTWRLRKTRRSPAAYLNQLETGNSGLEEDGEVSAGDRRIEQLIFGLRLTQGISQHSDAWQATCPERIDQLIDSGDLMHTPRKHLAATAQGRLRLDAVLDYLINHER